MAEPEVIQIGGHGPIYRLRGLTVEEVKASAITAEANPKPLRCRLKHRLRTIGDPYNDTEKDTMEYALSVIRNMDAVSLQMCKRCGAVTEKRSF